MRSTAYYPFGCTGLEGTPRPSNWSYLDLALVNLSRWNYLSAFGVFRRRSLDADFNQENGLLLNSIDRLQHVCRAQRWRLAVTVLAAAIVLSAGGLSEVRATTAPLESLAPDPKHVRAVRLITHLVRRYHYRKTALDDALSHTILANFIESLDSNRSYFLAQDLLQFERSRNNFDDYLKSAELKPAFVIFSVLKRRVEERVSFAQSQLSKAFDFSIDESYRYDRREAEWAVDRAELDDIWRKRVKNDVLNLRLAGKPDDEIIETLRKRYQRLEHRTTQLNADDVFQFFVNAYVSAVEPHTAYFSPRTSENFKIRMSLSLEGIGAVLQTENEYTLVRSVVPGGPAALSGQIAAGDRIVGVGQGASKQIVDVIGWRLDDVVDLIRGPKDTVVRIDVLEKDSGPDGPTNTIMLIRDRIKLEEQAAKKSTHIIDLEDRQLKIGVIELPAFYIDFEARSRGDKNYRSTTRDVSRLLKELAAEGVDGVMIDLRGNGGGSLAESTSLTGLFIEAGPVVQVKDSSGRIQINTDPNPEIVYDGPLAVLVDRQSASASEIFAGAIQDYGRGIVLGEPTFGKGTVQNLFDLNRFTAGDNAPLGQLKLTIAQFFRINGESTQHRGVIPDIVFPTAMDIADHGERALDNALPWAAIQPAEFAHYSRYTGQDLFIKTRQAHEHRISDDAGFAYLIAEAKDEAASANRREVSLIEAVRREERTRRDEEIRQRQNRLRAAEGLPPVDEDDETTADELRDDLFLQEATHILADYIREDRRNRTLERTVASETSDEALRPTDRQPLEAKDETAN